MTVVSAQRRGSLLGVVDRFWRKSGYRVTAINPNIHSDFWSAGAPGVAASRS